MVEAPGVEPGLPLDFITFFMKMRKKNIGPKANQYGKFTFLVFRGSKRVSISIEIILVKYFASLLISRADIFATARETVEALTKHIQVYVDDYEKIEKPDFSLVSYVKYQMLQSIFESTHAGSLKVFFDVINLG